MKSISLFLLPLSLFVFQKSTAQSCFTQGTNFTTGSLPEFIGHADFDADGEMDLYVTNYNDGTATIKWGDGSGIFSETTTLVVGSNPVGADAGDITGDGNIDLVVANTNSNNITLWAGDGAGNFTSTTIAGAPQNPFAVHIGNYSENEGLEMAVAGYTSGTIQIMDINGITTQTLEGLSDPMYVTSVNANGDGLEEIFAANAGANTITMFRSNGAGAYDYSVDYTVGSSPRSIALGDMNHDGLEDLVAVCDGTANAYILLNSGLCTFSNIYTAPLATGSSSVTVADFNNDTWMDFAVGGYNPEGIYININLRNYTYDSNDFYSLPGGLYALTSSDFNGDNLPDIATANYFEHNGSVLLNTHPTVTVTIEDNVLVASVGNVTYQWLDCNNSLLSVNGATDQSFEYPTGSFAVQINNNGCLATSECVDVTVAGVAQVLPSEWIAYPQPATDQLFIKNYVGKIMITDLCGKTILSTSHYQANAPIDLSSLSQGMYLLVLENNRTQLIEKL